MDGRVESNPVNPERPYHNKRWDFGQLYRRFLDHRFLNTDTSQVSPDRLKTDNDINLVRGVLQGDTFTEAEAQFVSDPNFQRTLGFIASKNPTEATILLYRAILNREADPDGFDIYKEQMRKGRSIDEIINEVVSSDENCRRMVSQLYNEILERDADSEGLQVYFDQLKSGRSIADIAKELKNSDEYQNKVKSLPIQDKYSLFSHPVSESLVRKGQSAFIMRFLRRPFLARQKHTTSTKEETLFTREIEEYLKRVKTEVPPEGIPHRSQHLRTGSRAGLAASLVTATALASGAYLKHELQGGSVEQAVKTGIERVQEDLKSPIGTVNTLKHIAEGLNPTNLKPPKKFTQQPLPEENKADQQTVSSSEKS